MPKNIIYKTKMMNKSQKKISLIVANIVKYKRNETASAKYMKMKLVMTIERKCKAHIIKI